MTSYAELLEAYSESQENFASLHGQYLALAQEIDGLRDQNAKLQQRLEDVTQSEGAAQAELRSAQRAVEEALGYKERYVAAMVAVENLKGRLETARRGVASTIMQHEQEVEQFRSHNHDLVQRIDAASSLEEMEKMKKQVRELEERAAILSGELMEEKQRGSQQLVTAHAALRDQQSRNLDLEQRYRAMEAETTQMRQVVRRSADVQNEAAFLKDRAVAEAARATAEAESLRDALHSLKAKLLERQRESESELAAVKAVAEEEKVKLLGRLSTLSGELDARMTDASAAQEQLLALQRSHQKQVASAREEMALEVDNLQRLLAEEREAVTRFRRKSEQLEEALRHAKEELHSRESRLASMESDRHLLQVQMDNLVQHEAWVKAELEHSHAKLLVAQKRIDELTTIIHSHEAAAMEVERVRVLLRARDADLDEARRHIEAVESRARDIEEAADRRVRVLRRELKAAKQQGRTDAASADRVRKKLIQALMERDAERAHLLSRYTTTAPIPPPPMRAQVAVAVEQADAERCGLDALEILKNQSQQAVELHHKVLQLSR